MQPKMEQDVSNLKSMSKGLSASLPDLDSESWIEVKKRPRPSPARPKVSGSEGEERDRVCSERGFKPHNVILSRYLGANMMYCNSHNSMCVVIQH